MPQFPTHAQRLAARERPTGAAVMKQVWSKLLFLHWEVTPEILQQRLPAGLFVDTFEEKAYLGLVPFYMEQIRPVGCPPVPGISWFKEINLRTYVYDERGEPGVWFFTLECNQWLAVKLARLLFNLPYHHAKMSTEKRGDILHYHSRRKGDKTQQDFTYPSSAQHYQTAEAGSFEFFLLERYRLYSTKRGELYEGMVHHTPYQYAPADASTYSTRTFSLCQFKEPQGDPVSSLIGHSVSVDIFPLRRVKND